MMEKIFGIEGVRMLVGDVITNAETVAELVNRILKVFNQCLSRQSFGPEFCVVWPWKMPASG